MSGTHSVAFRVMRLCRPTFHIETPVRFDLSDLIIGEDLLDDESASPHIRRLIKSQSESGSSNDDLTYSNRFIIRDDDPTDTMGMLVLPQAFGYHLNILSFLLYFLILSIFYSSPFKRLDKQK